MAKATINPTKEQRAVRTVERIKTLRASILKAQAKGDDERVASLQTELDRRLDEVRAMKAALAEVDV